MDGAGPALPPVPAHPAPARRTPAADAPTLYEPEPHEPADETCTFSFDLLCSDDTAWMDRELFGTAYRYDPSETAQGAPRDRDLGLVTPPGSFRDPGRLPPAGPLPHGGRAVVSASSD